MTTNPYILTGGSDGGAHIAFLCQVTYSSFLLSHWVREKKAMTLEQAVRKLTFDPAVLLGIPNRGLLKTGMAADLTIFDPDKVQAKAKEFVKDLPGGASRLISRGEGYRYTVVNGQVVLRDGEPTGACSGRVLRSWLNKSESEAMSPSFSLSLRFRLLVTVYAETYIPTHPRYRRET
jgi:N-acyl-D-aspartate/D-glutamate deacylase